MCTVLIMAYLKTDYYFTKVILHTVIMKSTKVQTLGTILLKCSNIWIANIFACMYILHKHNGTKTEFYRTNTKSQGLVPAHFALIIIIVVHVVKYQSVLINTMKRWNLA